VGDAVAIAKALRRIANEECMAAQLNSMMKIQLMRGEDLKCQEKWLGDLDVEHEGK
jgi:hypothetical protein